MICSLTGFGRGEGIVDGVQIGVEVKCLNSRNLDVGSLRLPQRYSGVEVYTRQRLAEVIGRGKVDLAVTVQRQDGAAEGVASLNPKALAHYLTTLSELHKEHGLSPDAQRIFYEALRLPGVVCPDDSPLTQQEEQAYRDALEQALTALVAFREQEGKATGRFLLGEVEAIEALRRQVDAMKDTRIEEVKQRYAAAIESLQGTASVNIDETRLAQEIFFYIEKLDVNEELQRLEQHCRYFRETVESEDAQGKKLNFIAQEMGREINTLGSKSNNVTMQHYVVEMKDHLERIKEQVLNVL